MSDAASRAKTAISCFSQVRSAAIDPAGLKLAEGLVALAQAVEGLTAEHDDMLRSLGRISSWVNEWPGDGLNAAPDPQGQVAP